MALSLLELITEVGINNVTVQNLLESTSAIRQTKRATAITFLTNEVTATQIMNETEERVGLVVWLPKDRTLAIDKRLAAQREKKDADVHTD